MDGTGQVKLTDGFTQDLFVSDAEPSMKLILSATQANLTKSRTKFINKITGATRRFLLSQHFK